MWNSRSPLTHLNPPPRGLHPFPSPLFPITLTLSSCSPFPSSSSLLPLPPVSVPHSPTLPLFPSPSPPIRPHPRPPLSTACRFDGISPKTLPFDCTPQNLAKKLIKILGLHHPPLLSRMQAPLPEFGSAPLLISIIKVEGRKNHKSGANCINLHTGGPWHESQRVTTSHNESQRVINRTKPLENHACVKS